MEHEFDAVVVGAGVAGLRAAIELTVGGARVAVVTKDPPDESSTSYAQGGIAVVLSGDDDDIVLHEEDTLRAGAGLCDAPAVAALVREGPEEVLRLIEWGARFDREGDRYHLTREAAHSEPRILHAGGDATGREIARALVAEVRRRSGAHRLAGMVTDLLVGPNGCAGVRVRTRDAEEIVLRSAAVVLATGGTGCCWARTSNPPEATGDGLALALRAGCELGDMEFVQFHPTAFALPGAPSFLLTEALRGEGAHVVDEHGRRFLFDDDPRGELAPRDVVARGIARAIARQDGRPVRLDLSPLDPGFVERRFPGIVAACGRFGVDPRQEPIPVAPAAHYTMGGVATDVDGRTCLPGLVAAGEVAAVGIHGANRLASNSLLDGLVFGARAARGLRADGRVGGDPGTAEPLTTCVAPAATAAELVADLRRLADDALGIVRDGARLRAALGRLEEERARLVPPDGATTRAGFEAASTVLVLRAVARAALWREESRGAHFREDFPARDDARWLCHSRQALDGPVTSVPVC